MAEPAYVVWHDEQFWADVAWDLVSHPNKWRHPGRAVLEARGAECDCADLAKATGRTYVLKGESACKRA